MEAAGMCQQAYMIQREHERLQLCLGRAHLNHINYILEMVAATPRVTSGRVILVDNEVCFVVHVYFVL